MKAVIIEDELLTAEDLANILIKLPEKIQVLKILTSIKEALDFFENGIQPDVIFCDIELGDGHSFEIFKKTKIAAPVIFCTAYDKYALQAFENNGIGYVVKPFTKKSIKEAVDRFINLQKQISPSFNDIALFLSSLEKSSGLKKSSSFLINFKEKIIPVKHNDIALFGIDLKSTFLITNNNQKFHIGYTLDELEQICGDVFFRANRQFLINRDAVETANQYSARKLMIKMKIQGTYEITVSKARVPEFLSWLKN